MHDSICNVVVIQGKDGMAILPRVINEMKLLAVRLADDQIEIVVPDYPKTRKRMGMEKKYPIYPC